MTSNNSSTEHLTDSYRATLEDVQLGASSSRVSMGRSLGTFISLGVLLIMLTVGLIVSLVFVISAGTNATDIRVRADKSVEIRQEVQRIRNKLNATYQVDDQTLSEAGFINLAEYDLDVNVDGLFHRWADPTDADWGTLCPEYGSCSVSELRTNSFITCPAGLLVRVKADQGQTSEGAASRSVGTNELVRIGVDTTALPDSDLQLVTVTCL